MSDADTVSTPERRDRLAREIAAPPFHQLLGAEAVDVTDDGGVTVRLPFRADLCGFRDPPTIHGGVIAALIDMTAHAAVAVAVNRAVPTIDLRIDYLRPAIATSLVATGRLVTAGRSLGRADVEVRAENGTLVALGRGVFSTLERPPSAPKT